MASRLSVKHFKRAEDIMVKLFVFVKFFRVLLEMSTKILVLKPGAKQCQRSTVDATKYLKIGLEFLNVRT